MLSHDVGSAALLLRNSDSYLSAFSLRPLITRFGDAPKAAAVSKICGVRRSLIVVGIPEACAWIVRSGSRITAIAPAIPARPESNGIESKRMVERPKSAVDVLPCDSR